MIEVDGSYGEGGGQIFRMALALSALTGEDLRIDNIRAGRPKPGLARQHLTAAEGVRSLCNASVEGLELGSKEVIFRPGTLRGGKVDLDVGTAGSVTLVLQACLLPASLAEGPSEFRIRGGTDVKWSPPSDYLIHVFLVLLRKMGVQVEMEVTRRGYYPRGGGIVVATVKPIPGIDPLLLSEQGGIFQTRGCAHVSNLPRHIPERMRRSALEHLEDVGEVDVEVLAYGKSEALGPGGALVLWAESNKTVLGSSGLAERGVPAEEIGAKAANSLMVDLRSGATLDVHAADQLLPYMAMAGGRSIFKLREVSGHTKTMFWLLSKFLDVTFRHKELEEVVQVDVEPSRT